MNHEGKPDRLAFKRKHDLEKFMRLDGLHHIVLAPDYGGHGEHAMVRQGGDFRLEVPCHHIAQLTESIAHHRRIGCGVIAEHKSSEPSGRGGGATDRHHAAESAGKSDHGRLLATLVLDRTRKRGEFNAQHDAEHFDGGAFQDARPVRIWLNRLKRGLVKR